MGARAHVQAVLDRVSMPLSSVLALKPGGLVPLSAGVLTKLRIESRGRFIAYGKLGQCNGNLAVRLLVAPDGKRVDIDPQIPQIATGQGAAAKASPDETGGDAKFGAAENRVRDATIPAAQAPVSS